jgi:hypothetical protein
MENAPKRARKCIKAKRQRKVSILYSLSSILLLICCWLNPYARLDCQEAVEANFCAVRLVNGAGVRVQWGARQRTALWVWGPDGAGERRLWPRETQ